MKYAVIADVHANVEALRAVLDDIARERADRIVCLGDFVGYNASPNECVELSRSRGVRAIAGNHDRAAIGEKDTARFGPRARRAIEWTKAELVGEHRDYLAALPSSDLIDGRFFVVHGALHPEPNDDLHLSNEARVRRSISELATGRFGSNVCFFGHNHRAAVYEYRKENLRRIGGRETTLVPDAHYLVNPGSVGQPRDGDWRAAYALFDPDRGKLELRRVAYDARSNELRSLAHGLSTEEGWAARATHWLGKRLDDARDVLSSRLRRP